MSAQAMERSKRRLSRTEILAGRIRAAARNRALTRLAREYADRYRELYAEERSSS